LFHGKAHQKHWECWLKKHKRTQIIPDYLRGEKQPCGCFLAENTRMAAFLLLNVRISTNKHNSLAV